MAYIIGTYLLGTFLVVACSGIALEGCHSAFINITHRAHAFNVIPCVLRHKTTIVCHDVIKTEDQFMDVMYNAPKKYITGVQLTSAALRYIPENAFLEIKLQSLLIDSSAILSLSDTEYAFAGAEDTLQSFVVTNCSFVNGWHWSHLKRLRKLEVLSVTSSNLRELSDEFLELSSLPLIEIDFKDNNINSVPEGAFANYMNLNRVSFEKNELDSYSRTIFPLPAKNLKVISLSYNRIQRFPNDAFIEMPVLSALNISGNPIHLLPAVIFQPILDKILIFAIEDAPLHCDCRLHWMVFYELNLWDYLRRRYKSLTGKCLSPISLKNKHLAHLKPEDLKCQL